MAAGGGQSRMPTRGFVLKMAGANLVAAIGYASIRGSDTQCGDGGAQRGEPSVVVPVGRGAPPLHRDGNCAHRHWFWNARVRAEHDGPVVGLFPIQDWSNHCDWVQQRDPRRPCHPWPLVGCLRKVAGIPRCRWQLLRRQGQLVPASMWAAFGRPDARPLVQGCLPRRPRNDVARWHCTCHCACHPSSRVKSSRVSSAPARKVVR